MTLFVNSLQNGGKGTKILVTFSSLLYYIFNTYFCTFAPVKMKVVTQKSVSYELSLGLTKDHYLLMVRSNLSVMKFANFLSRIYQQDFFFLADYVVDDARPQCKYPMFYSMLNYSQGLSMTLMSNMTMIDPNSFDLDADPLLGLFMFEKEAYIFNTKKRKFYDCPFDDYEYLLLVSCDSGVPIKEFMEPLEQFPKLNVKDVSEMMDEPAKKTKKNRPLSQRSSFLKNLFNDNEILIQDAEDVHLNLFLGQKNLISPDNYPTDRIPRAFVATSPLLYREDI